MSIFQSLDPCPYALPGKRTPLLHLCIQKNIEEGISIGLGKK
jgi:hypothetical protein